LWLLRRIFDLSRCVILPQHIAVARHRSLACGTAGNLFAAVLE
jgi:hypothetical protein